MGPVALFDKSFIEMLNIDEATIFDMLYRTNLCPIFYVEVLADLQKVNSGSRSAEKVVADVAKKTPVMNATPNVLHSTLCQFELLGHEIEMRKVPAVAGGRPVRHEGKVGVVYDQSPEAKAFERWQGGSFHEVERDFAAVWRNQLKAADHAQTAALVRQTLRISESPRNLEDAFRIAKEVVVGEGQRFLTLRTAYQLLGLDNRKWGRVVKNWKLAGRPSLISYAPYTAYCLLIDAFFHVAVGKNLISPHRPSNKTDIAYLYYLPFTEIFISNDKLHRRVTPFFLLQGQMFVNGEELKQDIRALDRYYSGLPEEDKARGLFALASRPPDDDAFMTTRIWKQLGMKTQPVKPFDHNANKEANDRLLARLKGMTKGKTIPRGALTRGEILDPNHIAVQRIVPVQRGKWRIMPPGVDSRDDD